MWARFLTRRLQFVLDLMVLLSAFALAYLLRFDFAVPWPYYGRLLTQAPYVVLIQFSALALAGVYTFIWRYIGLAELKSFLLAMIGSFIPLMLLRLTLADRSGPWQVPLSIILADTILAFGG